MIHNPTCPLCNNSTWRRIGARTYRLADKVTTSAYVQKRFRVLFEIWFPGAESVELTSMLCETCGFVCYTPRPTEADLDAKYRFLGQWESDGDALPPAASIERGRSRLLYRYIRRWLPHRKTARILDYGGGDGRLMQAFLAKGHACELVDYCTHPIPGVERVGTTLADLSGDARYDLIIASHVIEHVADPLAVVATLADRLTNDGALYVEVPMEIWGRPPLHEEPVTHVNFFTSDSTRYLLEQAGLRVSYCQLGGYPHPTGRTLLAVRAIGRPGASKGKATPRGPAEVERLLNPGLSQKLQRYALTPSTISSAIAHKLKMLARGR